LKPPKITRLRVFLSYASEQIDIAEQIYLTLSNSGHKVFFDRTDLPPGEDYNPAILEAIRSSDLFIFLISPHSVEDGAYTLTELRFARDTWPNPAGRILPVMAVSTDFSKIPNYLKAVTVLRPAGNLSAEVAATVNDIATGRSPDDTIFGQLELIKKTAKEYDELRQELEISEIDKAWEIEKKRYIVKVGNKEVVPSRKVVFAQGYMFIVMVIFFFFFMSRWGWGAVLTPLVIGILYIGYLYYLVRKYEKAEDKYYKRKEEIRRRYWRPNTRQDSA
jgi:hypothetical protein